MTSNERRVGEKEKSRKKRHKEEERVDAIACDEKVEKKEMTNNVMISDHDKRQKEHQEKKKRKKQKRDDIDTIACDEKVEKKEMTTNVMISDHDKRQQEHQEKKKRKKQKRDDTLNGYEDEKQMEKRKKKKMDGLMLFHESKAERKKGKKDVMKADDKEKVEKKRKAKKTKDDVIAGDEEHKKKVKEKKKNVKESGYEVEDGKETIANQSGNKAEIPEGRRDGGKKRKLETTDGGGKANSEGKTTKKKTIAADTSEHPTPQSKKVRFSDEVEVFPPDPENNSNETGDGLVRGKRFSKKEDAIIKKAVSDYIEANHLGEAGLDMILHCQSHPKIRDCWREISAALPWRPHTSVYYRAHILYERGDRNWTPEELELIRKSYEKHGSNWKIIAKELGKFRVHVKDAWRRIKLVEMKRGNWSQDEYQVLFELVNKDLQMKVYEEKNSKYGMLRDNISWEAISTTLGTRQMSSCCLKWYNQLTSPMVAEGKWADADDYRLLMMLVDLDASCEDEVDWDCLLEHRSGDLCRRRWDQMVNHLGEHGNKSFSEQVEVLSNRYCPDLVEVRDAVDARPIVD